MKVVNAVFGLMVMLFVAVAFAEEPKPYHSQYEEELLFCKTQSGKYLQVTRNSDSDVFSILYGEDLRNPEQSTVRRGNNMGTSYRSSAQEGVENREIYVAEGQRFTTVGVNDRQGKKTGYITILASNKEVVRDDCQPKTLESRFSDYEQFQSLTDVD